MNDLQIYNRFNLLKQRSKLGRCFVVDIISLLCFIMFLYAGTTKLLDYNRFSVQLAKSPYTTDFAAILVWLVPVVEITISILLLIGLYKKTFLLGLYGSFVVMLLFTFYIIAILKLADNIPCGCLGIFERMTWNQHLIFNVVFTILALTGFFLRMKNSKEN